MNESLSDATVANLRTHQEHYCMIISKDRDYGSYRVYRDTCIGVVACKADCISVISNIRVYIYKIQHLTPFPI